MGKRLGDPTRPASEAHATQSHSRLSRLDPRLQLPYSRLPSALCNGRVTVAETKGIVMQLIDDASFASVDLGGLARCAARS
jgi:hypothetical protein